MWWAIFKYALIILLSVIASIGLARSASAWPLNKSPDFIASELKSTHTMACSGRWGMITVKGQGSIEACIMGENVRVASYFPVQGAISYAISYPFDTFFYPLDVCTGFWGCVYSEVKDVLIGFSWVSSSESRGYIYKNFVKNLRKSHQSGVARYESSDSTPRFSIGHPSGAIFFAQTAAISTNGKWVVFEIRNYGIYRVNTETLQVRRLTAPGYTYTSYGPQPGVQLAISNDGKAVAVMGMRMSIEVVVVDDLCGDELTDSTETSFTGAVTPCRYVPIDYRGYVSNLMHAVNPYFSQDSSRLSFDAYGNGSPHRHVTLFSDGNGLQELSHYLAIGDSFTSGEGETDDLFYIGGPSNRCHVSSRSYPYLLGNIWGMPSYNAACSGATVEAIKSESNRNGQKGQLAEIEARLPQVLSVGVGGNDAGLMGKLKSCLGVDTCEWAETPDKRQNTALEIKNLYPKLRRFYEDLKIRTPGKVVVFGYPTIISSDPVCLAEFGILLNQIERKFMNEGIRYLNQVISAAANDSGLEFIDIENVFESNELCSQTQTPFMNGLRFGDDYPIFDAFANLKMFGAESFHPTPSGHEAIAQRVAERYTDVFSLPSCQRCTDTKGVPDAGPYWDGNGTVAKNQFALSFLSKGFVASGDFFRITLPENSFEPLSDVVIELHSNIKEIARLKAAEDGGLMVDIQAIEFEPGYHSVHVMGKTSSSQIIDAYDFVAIGKDSGQTALLPQVSPSPNAIERNPAPTLNRQPFRINPSSEILGLATLKSASTTPGKGEVYATKKEKINYNQEWISRYGLVLLSGLVGCAVIAGLTYYLYRKKLNMS